MQKSQQTDDPVITPIEPLSRRLLPWLFTSYFPSMASILGKESDVILEEKDFNSFSRFLITTVLRTYGFDGYDFITNKITSADGQTQPFRGDSLPLGLMLASFFGLPTRVERVVNGVPEFTGWQLVRNLFGGWNVSDKSKNRFEKKGWEIAALLFKILIIFPVKIVTFLPKLLVNIIKIFSEILPALLWFGITVIADYWGSLLNQHMRFHSDIAILLIIPAVLIGLPLMAIQYATVLLCRVGMALTSPEKSARLAFALGRRLRIEGLGQRANLVISYVMGALGVLLSLMLSAVLWTLLLPLALGTLTTLIPSLMSAITWVAQLPIVAGILAWFSSLSVVTGSMVLVNSLFATVGNALVVAFGPTVTTLAGFISVQVPAAVLVVGITLGMLVPPIAATLSWVADQLSNVWTKWIMQEGGPLTWLFASCVGEQKASAHSKDNSEDPVELSKTAGSSASSSGASLAASATVLRGQEGQSNADNDAADAEGAARRADEVPLLEEARGRTRPGVLIMNADEAREAFGNGTCDIIKNNTVTHPITWTTGDE